MKPEEFVTLYEQAIATQKWVNVAPLVHPCCTVTFSDGSLHVGIDKVQVAFQRNFDLIVDEKYSITEVHWVFKTENFAVYTYSFNWSGLIGGKEVSGVGRGTSSIIRHEHAWQLVSEHLGPKN